MPKLSSADAPTKLRPYLFHGLQLVWEGKSDATCECPFCGKSKFFIAQETGMWQCKLCGGPSKKGGGNIYNFLRELHQASIGTTDPDALEEVAEERKLPSTSLERWGLVQSAITKDWILPGYGMTVDTETGKRNIVNLYRWSKVGGKRRLVSTATMDHCLFGLQFWDPSKPEVRLQEGPWDAIALEVAFQRYGFKDGKTFRTGNPTLALFKDANIVAAPGCETFKDEWVKLFRAKKVYIGFDSDYPKRFPPGHQLAGQVRTVRGKPMVPGFLGMESTSVKLKPVASSILVADYGGDGYDSFLPDGFDARDCLTTDLVLKERQNEQAQN